MSPEADVGAAADAAPLFSLNQMTLRQWDVPAVVEGCAARGIPAVGLWRDKVAEYGLARTRQAVVGAGLAVTSLCRAGFFLPADHPEHRRRAEDNRAAVDEAAELGAACVVLVCGGLEGRDLPSRHADVERGVTELAGYAAQCGVRLAVEPLHPMFCADRSVISTLEHALTLAEAHDPGVVGVAVDTYNVWWDPRIRETLQRAGPRLACVQVADWVLPLEDPVRSRGLPGEGFIDFDRVCVPAREAGFEGWVEVEVFSDRLWALDGDEALDRVCDAYARHVGW